MTSRLSRVVAILASAPGRPEGDHDCALEFHIPLTADGQFDAAAFRPLAEYCRAVLTEAGAPAWSSPLLYIDGRLAVRPGPTEESPLWLLDARTIRPGDYLTLRPPEAESHAFRIVNVAHL